MLEKQEKCASQFFRTKQDACFVQTKVPNPLNIQFLMRNASTPHISEAETNFFFLIKLLSEIV